MIIKNYTKNILIFSLATLVCFFVFELSTRVLLWAISGNSIVWSYGKDQDVGIQVFDLSEFKIGVYRDTMEGRKKHIAETLSFDKKKKKQEFWAFGGSTTGGFSCSKNASSWPKELDKLAPHWTVKNYGRSGTNSDFAYRELLQALQESTPDWVLWANRVNEIDVLTEGFDRNKKKLGVSNKLNSNKKTILYLHRIGKTFERYSAFYFMTHDLIIRIRYKLGISEKAKKPVFSKDNLKLSVENYAINSEDMLKLSKIYGFRVGIITLTMYREITKVNKIKWIDTWDRMFIQKSSLLAQKYNAKWIDTRDHKYVYDNPRDLICDGAHQTLEGNRQMAKAILEDLVDRMP